MSNMCVKVGRELGVLLLMLLITICWVLEGPGGLQSKGLPRVKHGVEHAWAAKHSTQHSIGITVIK